MAVGEEVVQSSLSKAALFVGDGKSTWMSMLSSVGAVVSACSCCILPMALAGLGLSTGLGSVFSPLGPLRWPMVALSVLMLAISWLVVYRQRQQACGCDAANLGSWLRTPKVIMLMVASLLTLLAVSWGAFEPALMRAML